MSPELDRKRCVIMTTGNTTYRSPGQCAKRHGLRQVNLQDRLVPVCKHHRDKLERVGLIVVTAS